jgi:hypothetical protein
VLALKVNLMEIEFLCVYISLEKSLFYIHANNLHDL